ncbi:MAG: PH domain-containing protein [Pyrinomonadaceae bacterium]
MFCDKCGADNKDTAAFCRECGVTIDGIEEVRTQVAVRDEMAMSATSDGSSLGENERQIFSITPTLMFVKLGYVLAAVGALLLVAIVAAFTPIATIWAVLLGLLLFLIPAFFHIKQKLVRYTLTDSKLEIDAGLISRTTRSVPLRRIQDVTVSASVMQRLLGFGDLMIDNASEEAGKVILKNINDPKERAEDVMKQMRRLES